MLTVTPEIRLDHPQTIDSLSLQTIVYLRSDNGIRDENSMIVVVVGIDVGHAVFGPPSPGWIYVCSIDGYFVARIPDFDSNENDIYTERLVALK